MINILKVSFNPSKLVLSLLAITLVLGGAFFVANNHKALAQTEKKPDLTITDIYFYPSDPILGQKFTGEVRLKVSNIGNSAVQVVPGECLYQAKLDYDSATLIKQWLIDDLRSASHLICGPTISEEGEIAYGLTDAVFNSSVTLSAVIDSRETIGESNENNNSLTKEIIILAAKPDLTIAEVFFERRDPVHIGSPNQGERVRVAVNVENLGADLASNQGILNWSISVQDFVWENSPAISSGIDFDKTNPLRTGVVTQLSGYGRFTSSGTKTATFIVDAADELDEANETNNIYSLTIEVSDEDGMFHGDGTYELEIGNKVKLDNGSTIELVDINSSNYPKLQYAKAGNVQTNSTDYINTATQPSVSFSDYGIKVHFDVVGYKLPGGNLPYTKVTVESIAIVELKPDFTVTEVGVKYFYNSGNAGDYYYAVVKNIGNDLVFNKVTDLVIKFEGSPGWLGSSKELAYPSRKQYKAFAEIKSNQEIELMGSSTNQAYTGSYPIKVTVDPNNLITELNESNNSLTETIIIADGSTNKPDLTIDNFKYSRIQSDQVWDVQVEFDVVNNGRVTPESDFRLFVMNETMGTSIKEETYDDQHFEPGARSHVIILGEFGETFVEGENRLKIVVDSTNKVIESNEANNTVYKTADFTKPTGSITDVRHKVNQRLVNIWWETDGKYNCSVVFKGRSDIVDDLIYRGAGISIVHAGLNKSAAVILTDLRLPNRESDAIYYYRIVCRDMRTGDKVAQSDVQKIVVSSTVVPDDNDEVDDDSTPVQNDPNEAVSEEIRSLRNRIRKLERKISSLEREVIQSEKRLTKKINKALTKRLRGRILLQTEENGEAWYVDETTDERFYLRDGEAAYTALQAFGLGISNKDLELIPIGVEDRAERVDTDGDGLDDKLEEAIGSDPNNPDTDGDGFSDGEEVKSGFNPNGIGRLTLNKSLADRLEGKIILQVEGNGEAWYVHNGQRHYMKDGKLAYQIMRFLSLGITNDDLRQIAVGELE